MTQLSDKVLDLLFLFTTCCGKSELRSLQSMQRAAICPVGWTARAAGPSWFLIWSQDTARLIRTRTILLPRRWIGLSRSECLALASEQLARIEDSAPNPRTSPVLRDARHRIGAVLARHW
ncbi:hypothetical protein [Paracoccus aestuariivivens]|uniref:Uncharacterized protein n=1 Tax=Paracoccus aestuariivivens TaxID=1820333 RepID=A0A6L6J2K6_9RHOB|nr:hypothetical protein [Paracoccus aestuariivivens]MTH76150.1 hypothetical protein [Paracoccus aestuariivivens]